MDRKLSQEETKLRERTYGCALNHLLILVDDSRCDTLISRTVNHC